MSTLRQSLLSKFLLQPMSALYQQRDRITLKLMGLT